MTTEEAIGALLRNGLGHFLGNLPVLERGDEVEAVHQLRVAMRRLRSAFSLVYRFFPSAEFDALQEESRRIGTALGEARDWDVLSVPDPRAPCDPWSTRRGSKTS